MTVTEDRAGWAKLFPPRPTRYEEAAAYRAKLVRPRERVVVGYCYGQIEPLFEQSLRQMVDVDRVAGVGRFADPWCLTERSGANLTLARNRIVRRFMAMDGQPPWLLLPDTDMSWDAIAVERLLAAAAPDRIVGGLCFTRGPAGRIVPTIFDQDDNGLFTQWPAGQPIPENALIPCYGTGAAFLLVHREALERIGRLTPGPDCWFKEHERYKQGFGYVWTSEDLYFCDRAAAAGIKIFVHTGVEVGHVKPVVLNRALYEVAETRITWG